MSIKRYEIYMDAWESGVEEDEDSAGEWVKYEDVKHLIKREEVRLALLIVKEEW